MTELQTTRCRQCNALVCDIDRYCHACGHILTLPALGALDNQEIQDFAHKAVMTHDIQREFLGHKFCVICREKL